LQRHEGGSELDPGSPLLDVQQWWYVRDQAYSEAVRLQTAKKERRKKKKEKRKKKKKTSFAMLMVFVDEGAALSCVVTNGLFHRLSLLLPTTKHYDIMTYQMTTSSASAGMAGLQIN